MFEVGITKKIWTIGLLIELICPFRAVYAWNFLNTSAFSIFRKVQPIKKVYLKKNAEEYIFCVDLNEKVKCSSRIHTLPKGAKIIFSFDKKVEIPKIQKISASKIISGYFFEQVGPSTLIMLVSFKEPVIFSTQSLNINNCNCIRLKFKPQKKYKIVIDAGHGGKDSGTRCISGDYEKNIVLVAAVELRNELVISGNYDVKLTRDSDEFVRINQRHKKAENADLLISLHTDNNSDKRIRGMSVYTLPNMDFIKHKDTLKSSNNDVYYKILVQSRKFANILVNHIPTVCKFKKRPHRDEELKILKVPYPAVLIELGCTSNKVDNELLHSKTFRKKFNRAILYALDSFFGKKSEKIGTQK